MNGAHAFSSTSGRVAPALAVLSFLTPKSEVVWVSATGSVEQALERMKPNGFSAVPILDDDGCYVGTLSTSDLIWFLLPGEAGWQERARSTSLLGVPRKLKDSAVPVDADVSSLIARATHQPFVPIVDGQGRFVGLVRRRPLLEYCAEHAGLSVAPPSPPPRKSAQGQ
jgi:CBS domain-containing protein